MSARVESRVFANWPVHSGMNEVSQQWRHPQRQPPDASCSCTSCSPPLGAGHMAQPGTDQHESRVAVREAANHTGAAADLPVQPFNHIIGADAGPMFTGEIAAGDGFFNPVFHLFCRFFQLRGAKFFYHRFCLFPGGFLALLSVDRLEHFSYQLYLGPRRDSENTLR